MSEFLISYGLGDRQQDPGEATVDPQLKQLVGPIAAFIAENEAGGEVLDVGCGRGVLLRRLGQLDAFSSNLEWRYTGFDHESHRRELLIVGIDAGLNQRTDFRSLQYFYESWHHQPHPRLYVVRNVFHELSIDETARLVHALAERAKIGDMVLVQDLASFPEAEDGRACWDGELFKQIWSSIGFKAHLIIERTKSGNSWFQTQARPIGNVEPYSESAVRSLVITARSMQLEMMIQDREGKNSAGSARTRPISLADHHLQTFALINQLRDAGAVGVVTLDEAEEGSLVQKVFQAALDQYGRLPLARTARIVAPASFRDRAQSQDALEKFLLGRNSFVVIEGPPLMGKSYLIQEVLAHRSYDRQPIIIDCRNTITVWALLETYLGHLGITLESELIGKLKSVSFESLRSQLEAFTSKVATSTIVVLEHFDALLDISREVTSPELRQLITSLVGAPDAKVILCSRISPLVSGFQRVGSMEPQQPPVARFPAGKHVENLLDDFINRARLGLVSYPEELLDAIDRHPYLATLAAKIIAKEGAIVLTEPTFIRQLRMRLQNELIDRLSTDNVKPVIKVLNLVRGSMPRSVLEALTDRGAVEEAQDLGFIFLDTVGPGSTVVGVGPLRPTGSGFGWLPTDTDAQDERVEEIRTLHRRISEEFRLTYNETRDARWLREFYYHALAGGVLDIDVLGTLYAGEVFSAGEFWFRQKRDYGAALGAFKLAEKLGVRAPILPMRLASCMMRTGESEEGEREFRRLVSFAPSDRGLKQSFIDCLLYLRRFQDAVDALESYDMELSQSAWTAGQYGRAYTGLHEFASAVKAFEVARKLRPDEYTYGMLAHAYYRSGNRETSLRTLKEALDLFPDNSHIRFGYAAALVRSGEELETAEYTLRELHQAFPNDGLVLYQLVKLLILNDRLDEAENIANSGLGRVEQNRLKIPTRVEVLMAKRKWEEAVSLLGDAPPDDEHLVGMKRRLFAVWARTETDPDVAAAIARQGLSVPMGEHLRRNIPLLVTSARLARISRDEKAFRGFINRIKSLNAEVGELIEHEKEGPELFELDVDWERSSDGRTFFNKGPTTIYIDSIDGFQ